MAGIGSGAVANDATIRDEDFLLRRIHIATSVYRGPDGSRPNNGGFRTKNKEPLSVYVESMLRDRGLSEVDVLDGQPGFWLVALPVALVRAAGLGVVMDPVEDEGRLGEAHAVITGQLSGARRDHLSKIAIAKVWDVE